MKQYYVYRHIKPNGEVFYIGMGNNKRPYDKYHRSKEWYEVVNSIPFYNIDILHTFDNMEDALELEEILIGYYGRRNTNQGTLVNKTDGGRGGKGHIAYLRYGEKNPFYGKKHSQETIEYLRSINVGVKRSEEFVEKCRLRKAGENNPMYGKKHKQSTKQKIGEANSIKVINIKTNVIYVSISEASIQENIDSSWLMTQLKYGVYKNIKYLDDTIPLLEKPKPKPRTGEHCAKSKKVIDTTTGIIYDSIQICAKELNINYATLRSRVQSKRNHIKYYEDDHTT